MTKFSICKLFPAAAFLSASIAAAQTLDADVVTDPNAGTCTYTIDLWGPPSGTSLFVASLLQAPPFQLPGIWGEFEIDDTLMVPIGLVPLNPAGQGQAQVNGPAGLANELPLFFQALVIDNQQQLAFPNFAMAVPAAAPPPAGPVGPAAPPAFISGTKYNGATRIMTTTFTLGPAGGNVTVLVNGGQKAQGFMVLNGAGQGQLNLPIPGGMTPGDNVTILINGQPVTSWNH